MRPRAAITVHHEGHRKTYQIEQKEFESLSRKLIQRSEEITRRILRDNKLGWAHIDVVLTTGGASRMPMIRESLKKLSGRTLNSSLSPDQSIAHGAAYYAGMLLSNDQYARTVFNSTASSRLAKVQQQSHLHETPRVRRNQQDHSCKRSPFLRIRTEKKSETMIIDSRDNVVNVIRKKAL